MIGKNLYCIIFTILYFCKQNQNKVTYIKTQKQTHLDFFLGGGFRLKKKKKVYVKMFYPEAIPLKYHGPPITKSKNNLSKDKELNVLPSQGSRVYEYN